MESPPQRRRAARHQQPLTETDDGNATDRGPVASRKRRISVDAIVETAFGIVEREGYGALTMRRVASVLETGPASLYAHVVNKGDLDDLLIGRLCAEIELPAPDPGTWRAQIIDVCTQLRDQYLRYPGISLAALAVIPTNLQTLRVNEGMLGLALAGGVEPQAAVWTIDALFLYVNAFCLETSFKDRPTGREGWSLSREELLRRFAALPDEFPHTKRHAAELTSGTGPDRFLFTLNMMLGGLASTA